METKKHLEISKKGEIKNKNDDIIWVEIEIRGILKGDQCLLLRA